MMRREQPKKNGAEAVANPEVCKVVPAWRQRRSPSSRPSGPPVFAAHGVAYRGDRAFAASVIGTGAVL